MYKNKTKKGKNKTVKIKIVKNKTVKNKIVKTKIVKNKTPQNINHISLTISDKAKGHLFENPIIIKQNGKNTYKLGFKSYSPTVNQKLIELKTMSRENLADCNISDAFKMKTPLQINVKNKCYLYTSEEAKQLLMHNLAANKHVDPSIIIPPIQKQSNCWFNTMFATLFISDKGRKFFHYFRNLMIQGKRENDEIIPTQLADAFALLNFAIDAALSGSVYAYELDTNGIIKKIYDSIPSSYHKILPYIVNINKASNPIHYYMSMINYLDDSSLQILFVANILLDWESELMEKWKDVKNKNKGKGKNKNKNKNKNKEKVPHVIIFEIFDNASKTVVKPKEIKLDNYIYKLDSCVIRDTKQQHFCATIMCENKEMGYDGASFHRLVPMKWKTDINTNNIWEFEGTNNNGVPLKWSFMDGYQLLLYYRVK